VKAHPTNSIAALIERLPLGPYRVGIVVICFLIVLMDGFDTQAIGFAALDIASELGMPMTAFGPVFSAGLLGAMAGAFVLGPLGDRFGRKWILVGAVVTFALFSLSTAHVHDLNTLLLLRFLTGFGLGGAIPNLLALCSDYAPRRVQGLLTGILYAGLPLGGATSAATSAYLVPEFGWRALFYVGGVFPLLLAVVIACCLPESLQVLMRRRNGQPRIAAILQRIEPAWKANEFEWTDAQQEQTAFPFMRLFSNGRTAPTLLLWIACFMCFVLLIVLVLWTPALLRQAGVSGSQASLIVGLVNLGSVAGTALGGRLVDRYGPTPVLPLLFTAGVFSVAAFGLVTNNVVWLAVFATLSGFMLGGGSSGLLSVAILIYPSEMRATGVGWAMALGRMGQVTGPLVIGALISNGLAVSSIFLSCAIPAATAAVAAALLQWTAPRLSAQARRQQGRAL
jgi:AAHS family 4-hydroxybenzoate transporter-like MFS transporter